MLLGDLRPQVGRAVAVGPEAQSNAGQEGLVRRTWGSRGTKQNLKKSPLQKHPPPGRRWGRWGRWRRPHSSQSRPQWPWWQPPARQPWLCSSRARRAGGGAGGGEPCAVQEGLGTVGLWGFYASPQTHQSCRAAKIRHQATPRRHRLMVKGGVRGWSIKRGIQKREVHSLLLELHVPLHTALEERDARPAGSSKGRRSTLSSRQHSDGAEART